MHTPDENATPARPILKRLIRPWEYRHLHAAACIRFGAGGFTLGVGSVLLSLGRSAEAAADRRKCFGWAAWFLTIGTLNVVGGFMDMAAAREPGPEMRA